MNIKDVFLLHDIGSSMDKHLSFILSATVRDKFLSLASLDPQRKSKHGFKTEKLLTFL